MTPEARIEALAKETRNAAARLGLRLGSYSYSSFCKGQFQVAVSQHPAISPLKIDFLRKTGVIQ